MAVALAVWLAGCSSEFDPYAAHPETGRWYSPEQVAEGKRLYARYCASCHGDAAEGAPNWVRPDAEGLYPPPPLDGTAHAWHHPYPVLREVILEGTMGRMPGWKGTLDESDVKAVIAAFQDRWPEQGYQLWQQRHRH